MMPKIYASGALDETVIKQLEQDTGTKVYPVSGEMERNSPVMCEYCGNRSHWRLDVDLDVIGHIHNGQLVMPDIQAQFASLLEGRSGESLLYAFGFLTCLMEVEAHSSGEKYVLRYPWSLDDGEQWTDDDLGRLFERSFDDCYEAFSEALLDGTDIRCVVCGEEGVIRDMAHRGGPWHGRHDDQCPGCFVCCNEFPSKSKVIDWCAGNIAEALPEVFTTDELRIGADYVAKQIEDRLQAPDSSDFRCIDCQNYFSCLNYSLAPDSIEIVAPAVSMALDERRVERDE